MMRNGYGDGDLYGGGSGNGYGEGADEPHYLHPLYISIDRLPDGGGGEDTATHFLYLCVDESFRDAVLAARFWSTRP